MLNKETKKDILKIITFTVLLVFAFIYINPMIRFLSIALKLLMPFIIGIAMAFILNILVSFLERKLFSKVKMNNKTKHNLSIILSLAIVFSFLTFLFLLIIPQVKNTTDILIENMPKYQENVVELLDKIGVNNNVRESIIESTKKFSESITEYIKDNSDTVLENVIGIASNVVTSIINITIGLVFAIYLLVEKERLIRQTNKVLNAYLKEEKVHKINNIAKLSNRTFANFVSGQFLEAFIIGILCLIGMLILRIPYAITISVLVGFTALIPVFGAFIGTGVGAFLIFMISPIKALIFIIFILVLQQLEGNLIYPKVMGKRVNLPGLWVFVAVTIGGSISGILGMLISVPICSILYSIIATNVNSRLELKKENKQKEEKRATKMK